MKYLYKWLRADGEEVDSALYDDAYSAADARAKHVGFGAVCSPIQEVDDDYKPYHWSSPQAAEDKEKGLPTKEHIFAVLSDAVSDFVYYRRKEDEELSVEAFAMAVKTGVVTADEIADEFRRLITNAFEETT